MLSPGCPPPCGAASARTTERRPGFLSAGVVENDDGRCRRKRVTRNDELRAAGGLDGVAGAGFEKILDRLKVEIDLRSLVVHWEHQGRPGFRHQLGQVRDLDGGGASGEGEQHICTAQEFERFSFQGMAEVSLVGDSDAFQLEFNQGVGALLVLCFIDLEGRKLNASADHRATDIFQGIE